MFHCESDNDCNNKGICSSNGDCNCNPGWDEESPLDCTGRIAVKVE